MQQAIMKIKYIVFYVKDVEWEINFFTNKLNFKLVEVIDFKEDQKGTLIKSGNDNIFFCLVQETAENKGKNAIILTCEDCVKEYINLKNNGINSIARPENTPSGLMMDFTDNFKNQFILLEEREYGKDN
jgi:hypothetical protein